MLEYAIAFLVIYVNVLYLLIFLENRTRLAQAPAKISRYPSITVLVPAHNEEESIQHTIRSVLESDYPASKLSVMVIENASTDKTLRKARAMAGKRVQVYSLKEGGKGHAINFALKRVRTELVATLDADSFVEKDALKKLVPLFADKEVMAATANVKAWQPKGLLERLQGVEYVFTVFARRLLSFMDSVNVTPGPLSVFRTRVFKEVGGFDEKSILEDQEIALRIQSHNYRIASSLDAVVYSRVPHTFQALVRQRVRWNRGGLRNMYKHNYFVNPKYGDFSIFFIIGALGLVALTFLLWQTIAFIVSGDFLDIFRFGVSSVPFGILPIHVIGVFILALSIAWLFVGLSATRTHRVSLLTLIPYLAVYSLFMTIFWMVTLFQEARGAKLQW